MVRHLGICLYGFGKVMCEKGTFESIIFLYFIALYMNCGAWVTKGVLGGRGDPSI